MAGNGADIRLAVDAVEDMFRPPDLTHVVIVAGDSDYIALAQRCKRLGRYVVGIGVAGSSSRMLAAACDDFVIYDALPGVPAAPAPPTPRSRSGARPLSWHPGPAGGGHRPADPRPADRPGEGRRRWLLQLGGQGADEADGPVFLGEVVGLQVIQRLPCARAPRWWISTSSTTRLVKAQKSD